MRKNYNLLPLNYGEAEARLAAVAHYIENDSLPSSDTIISLLGFVPVDQGQEDLKSELENARHYIELLKNELKYEADTKNIEMLSQGEDAKLEQEAINDFI